MILWLVYVVALWFQPTPTYVTGWDAVPGATHYRIYWSASPSQFCDAQSVDVPAIDACGSCPSDLPAQCCYESTEPDGAVLFWQVRAWDASIGPQTLSPWETGRGLVAGPCPTA